MVEERQNTTNPSEVAIAYTTEGLVTSILDKREVGESGRVLVLFEAIHDSLPEGIKDKNLVDAYMFLLGRAGIMPTRFRYHWAPLPASPDLRDDLEYLVGADYLSQQQSSLSITERGRQWVADTLSSDKEEVLKIVGSFLEKWSLMTENELFWLSVKQPLRSGV